MPKTRRTYQPALPARQAGESSYQWLYRVVRDDILTGRLRPGARLPSTRELSTQYQVARGTVVTAFEILKSEGYLESTVGSGTFVADVLPDDYFKNRRSEVTALDAFPRRRLSTYGQALRLGGMDTTYGAGAFRAHAPAVDLFPSKIWASITAKCARRMTLRLLEGCEDAGLPALRAAIANYLCVSRGVRCSADQVIIVSGVLEALDICVRVLLTAGDRVCVEDPGYPDAGLLLESAALKVVPVAVDENGIQIDNARFRNARLIYVTPAHQSPLGVTMSLSRRLELLDVARRTGALIFEDDYDSEYRYSGRPVPALQGLDRHGYVIFAGSFSKVLFPGLRLGYVVPPLDLVPAFRAVRRRTVRHGQILDQLALTEFVEQGHLGHHLRAMRQTYAERLSVLSSEIDRRLQGALRVSPIQAGLQTIGYLTPDIDANALVRAATDRGLIVTSLDRYVRRVPAPNALMLGFATTQAAAIRKGVAELAAAVETLS